MIEEEEEFSKENIVDEPKKKEEWIGTQTLMHHLQRHQAWRHQLLFFISFSFISFFFVLFFRLFFWIIFWIITSRVYCFSATVVFLASSSFFFFAPAFLSSLAFFVVSATAFTAGLVAAGSVTAGSVAQLCFHHCQR